MYSKSYTVHKQFVACFLDRNISMFTSLGNNLAWCGCSMYPPELNTRSNGTLVPQIHRYFPTSTESSGNLLLFCFYQSKGLLLTRYDLFLRLLIGSSTGFLLGTFSRIASSPIAFFRWRGDSSSSRVGGFFLSATAIGIGTGGAGGAIAPPIIVEG